MLLRISILIPLIVPSVETEPAESKTSVIAEPADKNLNPSTTYSISILGSYQRMN